MESEFDEYYKMYIKHMSEADAVYGAWSEWDLLYFEQIEINESAYNS